MRNRVEALPPRRVLRRELTRALSSAALDMPVGCSPIGLLALCWLGMVGYYNFRSQSVGSTRHVRLLERWGRRYSDRGLGDHKERKWAVSGFVFSRMEMASTICPRDCPLALAWRERRMRRFDRKWSISSLRQISIVLEYSTQHTADEPVRYQPLNAQTCYSFCQGNLFRDLLKYRPS
jgi:hypothetical protein